MECRHWKLEEAYHRNNVYCDVYSYHSGSFDPEKVLDRKALGWKDGDFGLDRGLATCAPSCNLTMTAGTASGRSGDPVVEEEVERERRT